VTTVSKKDPDVDFFYEHAGWTGGKETKRSLGALDALDELRRRGEARVAGATVLVRVFERGQRWRYAVQVDGDGDGASVEAGKTFDTRDDAIDAAMQAGRIAIDIAAGRTNATLLRAAAARKRGWPRVEYEFFADHFHDVAEGSAAFASGVINHRYGGRS
jgi:hypothetical protein